MPSSPPRPNSTTTCGGATWPIASASAAKPASAAAAATGWPGMVGLDAMAASDMGDLLVGAV